MNDDVNDSESKGSGDVMLYEANNKGTPLDQHGAELWLPHHLSSKMVGGLHPGSSWGLCKIGFHSTRFDHPCLRLEKIKE